MIEREHGVARRRQRRTPQVDLLLLEGRGAVIGDACQPLPEMKTMPKPFGFAGRCTSSNSAAPDTMP